MLTNLKLVDDSQRKKFTIILTGMSTYKDIDKVLKILKEKLQFALYTAYPLSSSIKRFEFENDNDTKKNINVMGYSGHEKYGAHGFLQEFLVQKLLKDI